MKNKMFKIISTLFGVVILILCTNALLGKMIEKNNLEVIGKILDVSLTISVILLILSSIVAAILSVKECISKEGRQYVDKFLLKVVCIFVLLFVFRYKGNDYLNGVVYPALVWIIVPRAYDYITTNE